MSVAPTVEIPAAGAPERRTPPPAPPRSGGRGPGGGGDGGRAGDPAHVAVTGIWIALAPVLMLFMAFASAYVVRKGLGGDWVAVEIPKLLWANTGVLLLSSAALERARRAGGRAAGPGAAGWLAVTIGLGLVFVLGQVAAWRELTARGVGIASTPYSSFFYLLTGAHAVHLAGGILGLGAAAVWPAGAERLPRPVAIRVAAIYWHFMGVLWLGLFLLLLLWR